MEQYSVVKRNEMLIHFTIWMNPENSLLLGSGQTQMIIYVISFLRKIQESKSIETESRCVVAREGGRQNREVSLRGTGLPLGEENLGLDNKDGCTTL